MPSKERRGASRQNVRLRVVMQDEVGETRDVSATGVCFYISGSPPPPGAHVELLIDIPPGVYNQASTVRFEAEVVRVEPAGEKHAVAAHFLDWQLARA